ncbi:maleylacetate reductase [Spirillospora sp. CA-255316]
MRFVHDTLGQRVRFASGEAAEQLADEITHLRAGRVLVIAAEPERTLAERVCERVPVVAWHHEVAMHVPLPVAERARAVALEHNVDAVVSVGGGSTTGLAKAVALTTGVPIVAIPTTYSGSEATNVWGVTEGDRKMTGVDPRVLPRTVIYDAELTLTLPVATSVASGLNALAHCVDSFWAPRADPINAAFAGEGIRALRSGLPQVAADPGGLSGREVALHGAYVSAVAFASAGSGLHHKICHVLGGMFDLPHAQTHAVVLPHVLAFNAPSAPEVERRIAVAFDAPSANEGLRLLRTALDAPRALKDYGMPGNGIPAAVEAVLAAVPAGNPTTVTRDNLAALVQAAWEGDPS